jgi:hypothetical protein
MVKERGPTDSQPESRLKDNIDAVSSSSIKSKFIETQKNITITRNSKKPKNLKSNVTNKFSDLRIYHENIRGSYSVNEFPSHHIFFV